MMLLAGSMYPEVVPFGLRHTHSERLRHYKSQVLLQIPPPSLPSAHVHHTGVHSPVTEAQEMYDSNSKKTNDRVTEIFGYTLGFVEPSIPTSNLREVAEWMDPGEQKDSLDHP